LLGLLAIATTIVALYARSIYLVYFSFVVYGIFFEISSSAGEALFADSVPQGDRSKIFTQKAMLTTVAAGVGPGLTFVTLLLTDTNRWSTEIVSMVLVIGNLMLIPALGAMFFFRNPTTETDAAAEAEEEKGPDAPAPAASGACSRFLRPAAVPYIICSADFVTCIGAGMTVKFFNLFFIKDYKFTDADINILQCVYPAVIAGAMGILQKISTRLGRAQTSCASFALNATFFLVLWKAQSLPVLIVIFLIRGGLANGTAPIDRSILMDYVPSEQRGRWNAIESFTGATWSGSAFLGGWLSDSHDYRYTFLITAFIYYSASVVYLPLLAIVPRKEKDAARDVNPEASTTASSPVDI
jgi:MFS family permease